MSLLNQHAIVAYWLRGKASCGWLLCLFMHRDSNCSLLARTTSAHANQVATSKIAKATLVTHLQAALYQISFNYICTIIIFLYTICL